MDFKAKGLKIFEEEVSVGRLRRVLEKAFDEAMTEVDLGKMLHSQYRILPWENKTVVPRLASYSLRYLAALALMGDVETLHSYHKSFIEGEKLGFETSIEEEHLERAMVIAQEVKREGKFSYDLLERVAEKWSIAMDYQFFRVRPPNTCNQKRDFHKKIVEEKKQELREQGYIVSDEPCVFAAEGVKHAPDITYIKDGKIAFMDIKID
ncbi:DUF6990 domain-containing protein [Bartonella sp. TT121SHDZB]|uniref:DUF6990 domain-containing protein n=1 Tax=Bartonella sp. TT121SHDZB TaxID=3243580 RepID=UPI0035CF6C33